MGRGRGVFYSFGFCITTYFLFNFVCSVQKCWKLGQDSFYSFGSDEKSTEETLPSCMLAEKAIEYARELEMIV